MRPRPDPYSLAAALSQQQAPTQGALSGALMQPQRPAVPEAYWGQLAAGPNPYLKDMPSGASGTTNRKVFENDMRERGLNPDGTPMKTPEAAPASPGTAAPTRGPAPTSTPEYDRWTTGWKSLIQQKKATNPEEAMQMQAGLYRMAGQAIPPEAKAELAAMKKPAAKR